MIVEMKASYKRIENCESGFRRRNFRNDGENQKLDEKQFHKTDGMPHCFFFLVAIGIPVQFPFLWNVWEKEIL